MLVENVAMLLQCWISCVCPFYLYILTFLGRLPLMEQNPETGVQWLGYQKPIVQKASAVFHQASTDWSMTPLGVGVGRGRVFLTPVAAWGSMKPATKGALVSSGRAEPWSLLRFWERSSRRKILPHILGRSQHSIVYSNAGKKTKKKIRVSIYANIQKPKVERTRKCRTRRLVGEPRCIRQ